jgi:putative hydrolase
MTSPSNGFEGLLQDLLKAMGGAPSSAWFEAAKALAVSVVSDEEEGRNPDPVSRIRLEELGRVVALHVAEATGSTSEATLEPVTRANWAVAALTSWRPRLEPVVAASATTPVVAEDEDPATAMLTRFASAMGPMFLGLQVGSTAGHLAERARGSSAFPLPWPGSTSALVVVRNVEQFASDWSLDRDAVSAFTIARELTARAVYARAETAARVEQLLEAATAAQMAAQRSILQRLTDTEHSEDLTRLLSDPEEFLEGLPGLDGLAGGPAHDALNAAVTALSAYFDEIARRVTEHVVGNVAQLAEAWHRHRVGDSKGVENAGSLFGLDLSRERVELGQSFIAGVLEREGDEALSRLTRTAAGLPTPAEIVAPGLWLARTALPELEVPPDPA